MKKLLILLSAIFIFAVSGANAAELKFIPREGGKYIYCNNREFIFRSDLADNSNMNPRFIMSNEDMGADKYTLFASHVNHTEIKDSYGIMSGKGFDIELDVMFRAKEDTDIVITAMGFEVPENVKYYINREEYTAEKDWGCFTAWASYLGEEISKLDSGEKYKPVPFETVKFSIKAGETVYLSEFIPNYRAVPIWRPVHLMTDFEILSGICDINVLAVRSDGGVTGNRKYVSKNIAFGSFIPQYEMKGVANSQNQVDAYVDLVIPSDVYDGAKLPVTVYNRYAPEGNTVTTWYTNLNPTSDIWNKNNVAESCMLAFEYKDPSKKRYYGNGIKDEEKDDVWHFDTNHALLWEYKSGIGFTKRNFVPNFEITKDISEEYCNSLGNYGVFQNYHVTVTNDGYTDRWLNYCLNTGANNLIILRDENGNIVDGYPLTKGTVGVKESDRLVNIRVPAKESVKFILTVILTTNYPGGMENLFVVNDYASPVYTYDSNYVYNVRDSKYTGREYLKFEDGKLYTSADLEVWAEIPISSEVKSIFETSSEIKVTWTGDGYIVNNTQHSGIPYYNVRDFYREVWMLDESFNLKRKDNFEIYPSASSGAFGIYYIKAGSNYYSSDGNNWNLLGNSLNLPCYNYGKFAASSRHGEICLSEDGLNFNTVIYEGRQPLYIDSIGDIYYYISGRSIYVSANGVYWTELEVPCEIEKIGRKNENILVNEDVEIELQKLNTDAPVIKLNGRYLGFENEPEEINGIWYISLRSLCNLLGGSIEWISETNTAHVSVGDVEVSFTEGENAGNGTVMISDGKMMIPTEAVMLFEG